ncbi:MAG: hypothetical protein MZV64_54055 [Ignavibacteriales bacterium]|nr:hypothetical protein [Ignavibacteriales bacterium]
MPFLASTIFTIILTPFLFKFSPFISIASGSLESTKQSSTDNQENLHGHVIIAGFGLNGSNLARVLKKQVLNMLLRNLIPILLKEKKQGVRK